MCLPVRIRSDEMLYLVIYPVNVIVHIQNLWFGRGPDFEWNSPV